MGTVIFAAPPAALRTGVAEHAFDHLGAITDLAGAATASGANIIYCNGIGPAYLGLPTAAELTANRNGSLAYLRKARAQGVRLAIGYVCATSIVKLETFDKNWTLEFRARFRTPPAQWRQLGKDGQPLPSWYPAPYEAACMNNPDWRTYEKFVVREQLESGCDGIFFDNPTVHPNGCYCHFCMEKFEAFLADKHKAVRSKKHPLELLRQWAVEDPAAFLEFRAMIAADFLAEMRTYARSVKSGALVACNNSLNSPDVLFSQCRAMGYNINTFSVAEDFVLIEDMGSQAHTTADGHAFEYGSTYKLLHAISHEKPIVACTLVDADYYHALPQMARLSMAEAAANDASWLLWPAWPEKIRDVSTAAILPEARFLRDNEKLLNDVEPRADVSLFLCFRRWLETDKCIVGDIAAALTRENIQYAVHSEEDFAKLIQRQNGKTPVLLLESLTVLNAAEKKGVEKFQRAGGRVVTADTNDWLAKLRQEIGKPSLTLSGPPTVRAVIRDQSHRSILHLYNLNVQRISPSEEKLQPAENIKATVRVPFKNVHSVHGLSADSNGVTLSVDARRDVNGAVVTFTVPRLEIETIFVIE